MSINTGVYKMTKKHNIKETLKEIFKEWSQELVDITMSVMMFDSVDRLYPEDVSEEMTAL